MMYSISRRIFVSLAVTTMVTSLCAYGWIYREAKVTEHALRQRALLDQASLIASHLALDESGEPVLNLPTQLTDNYKSSAGYDRYAIRDQNGSLLFGSGPSTGPLPLFGQLTQTAYDYDPDGPGPRHMFGAALKINLGSRIFFAQVEQDGLDSQHLRAAVNQEFLTDGGWLQAPFLIAWLGVSVLAVRRALAPMKQVSRVAEMIDPATADVRLPTSNVPQELFPLVNAINLALDRLENGLRRQREFNADAAHQLRTPLAILSANIEAMSDKSTAAKLNYDVELMSRIVNQLLLVARLETFSNSNNDKVDVSAIATDVAANLAPLAIASGKNLEVVNGADPVFVRADAEALRAALNNLVENALGHTELATTVSIRLTQGPSVEVIDCGPGVPIDKRNQVFERFWKGDRNGKGAGLGLAIVKQIMTALHGSVSVSGNLHGGATFTLRFPSNLQHTQIGDARQKSSSAQRPSLEPV
jgi:signal transduction histidine kinase